MKNFIEDFPAGERVRVHTILDGIRSGTLTGPMTVFGWECVGVLYDGDTRSSGLLVGRWRKDPETGVFLSPERWIEAK